MNQRFKFTVSAILLFSLIANLFVNSPAVAQNKQTITMKEYFEQNYEPDMPVSTITINSTEDFYLFDKLVATGRNEYIEGKTFLQTCDLVLSPYHFYADDDLTSDSFYIQKGNESKYKLDSYIDLPLDSICSFSTKKNYVQFNGTYDGGNHCISGFSHTTYGSNLFGVIGTTGVVKNIRFSDFYHYDNSDILETDEGFGNFISSENYGLIENCNFDNCIIQAKTSVYCYYNYGEIRNCIVDNARISSTPNATRIGTFANALFYKIDNCHVKNSTIVNKGSCYCVGGIVSEANNKLVSITNCSLDNNTKIIDYADNCNIGGIVCQISNMQLHTFKSKLYLLNCVNEADIIAKKASPYQRNYAGIITSVSDTDADNAMMYNCMNFGNIMCDAKATETNLFPDSYGLIGFSFLNDTQINIKNCANYGNIQGYAAYSSYIDCTNGLFLGTVTASDTSDAKLMNNDYSFYNYTSTQLQKIYYPDQIGYRYGIYATKEQLNGTEQNKILCQNAPVAQNATTVCDALNNWVEENNTSGLFARWIQSENGHPVLDIPSYTDSSSTPTTPSTSSAISVPSLPPFPASPSSYPIPTATAAASANPTPTANDGTSQIPAASPSTYPTLKPEPVPTADDGTSQIPAASPSTYPTLKPEPVPTADDGTSQIPAASPSTYPTLKPEPVPTADANASPVPKRPSTPLRFTATPISNDEIMLKWKSVSKITGYRLYRSTHANSGFKQIASLYRKNSSYCDKKCKKDTKYYYRLCSYISYKNNYTTTSVNSSFSKTKVTTFYYQTPKLVLKTGITTDSIKYLSIRIKKYKGAYMDLYIKKDKGHFIKYPLSNKKIQTYHGKINLSYKLKKVTIYVKVRTYSKKRKIKKYSNFTPIRKIKL